MGDLFGAWRLCSQSVADWVRGKAAALAPVAAQIAALAAQAPVRCLDETGFRVAGKGQWLHTVATETLTHYRVSAKRGEMPEGLTGGVAVHDGFKSYCGLNDVRHALCNAHHLRELKALVEIDREPWAAPMRDLLLEANRAVEQAREAAATSLPPPVLEGFIARYWEILRQGLAFHRNLPRLQRHPSNRGRTKHRPGHNLLIRLHEFKDDVLRFLVDFSVPFTNNLDQQPGRTGPAHDEGQDEDLRRLSHLRSRLRLRRPALGRRNRPQATLEHPPDPDRSSSRPHSRPGPIATSLGVTASANLFETRLTFDGPRNAPKPLPPFFSSLEEGRTIRRAALATLLRKFKGPGAYEGLWELLARTYRALADGAAPPVTASEVLEVNRMVEALKPKERSS